MKTILLLAIVFLTAPAFAQVTFHSFEEVLTFADDHSFNILSAELGEEISLAEKREASSYLLPSANVSMGYNDNITLQPSLVPAQFLNPQAPEGEFEELTFGTKYQYTRGFQAQWDVLNFQKMFAAQAASLRVEETKLNTEVSRLNTYNSLASTYYSILLTQEAIKIYEENLHISQSIYQNALQKYEQGVFGEAERNLSEIRKLQSERNLQSARNNLDQFYIQLKSQLNTDEELRIVDSPDSFVVEKSDFIFEHPAILAEEIKLERYELLLKQQRSLKLPTVSMFYQNNRTWATNDFNDFDNASELPSQVFGLQLTLSNLLNPGNRQKVKQYKSRVRLQEEQLDNVKRVTRQEDELLELQLSQTSSDLERNREILALQEVNDGHAENKYQSGILSLDGRLDSYDELLVAQDMYLQSLASYTLAQYKVYIRQKEFETH